MRRALFILCGLLIVVWGLPCQAAIYPGDTEWHLNNVVVQAGSTVNGTYNVDFIWGYNADMLDFGTALLASAQDAVNARLNADGFVTVGQGGSYYDYVVPNKDSWTDGAYQIWISANTSYPSAGGWTKDGSLTNGSIPVGIYADFTPAAVPIPGAVWLLGSGLIGIVGIRRKFKT